ncbi:hypothetical protein MKW98_003822 [Papaver atlanticum]|uniref:Uncharacterized protein n=1 Tax=Papaver atlanticum TaxID=357466 RepID=A0AAD4X8J4_9MAGN|nr:hypothetical protein MKW98_003822 [Papaver atlanticum]
MFIHYLVKTDTIKNIIRTDASSQFHRWMLIWKWIAEVELLIADPVTQLIMQANSAYSKHEFGRKSLRSIYRLDQAVSLDFSHVKQLS